MSDFISINTQKSKQSKGYRDSLIGTEAFVTTDEGDETPGTITGWYTTYLPVVTLHDGSKALLDQTFRTNS